jgi:DNA-binding NtrC family response regulator
MIDATILTVTSNEEFLSHLRQQLHNQLGAGSRMIVAGTIDEACSLLDTAHPRVVVVHCTGENAVYDQVDQLLWATTVQSRRIPVIVIADRYRVDQATMLFRMGVSEYISRSHHLDQLGQVFSAYVPQVSRVDEDSFAEVDSLPVEPVKAKSAVSAARSAATQLVRL